jgi:C1A family cysteine protease
MGHFFNGSRLALYYWAREMDGSQNEDAGSYLRTMAAVLAKKGVPLETLWPYVESRFATKPPANVDAEAIKSTCTKYYRVDGSTPTETLNNIKAAISTSYPVMFGFNVYKNFFNIGVDGNMPMGAGDLAGGHAVSVQGYNDTHANIDGSNGALFIKNSWGTGWGAKGYFWMPYNYVIKANNDVGDAWEIIDESDFVTPPTPPTPPTPVPSKCFP